MKKLVEMFKGRSGEISSKRVVGVIGAFVLFGTMAHNSLSAVDIAPSSELVEAVQWITIACLGFTSAEYFSPKKDS